MLPSRASSKQMSWGRRLMQAPVTLVITLSCLAAMVVPGLTSWLEFDAVSVASGEYWRLITAQLTHFSWSHIAWDLAVFACLGYLCESRSRWLTYLALVLSTVLIAGYCVMHLEQYRGLSGLDTALFALLNTLLLWQRYRERDWPAVGVFATSLILMLGKIGWETVTGNCLFVDAASLFTPIPFAHLVGALVGLILGSLRFGGSSALSPQDAARRQVQPQ